MQFYENGRVEHSPKNIKYEFADDFVFFEDDQTQELFVALRNEEGGHYRIPGIREDFSEVDWFTFEKAVKKIPIYRDKLLRARQHFYYGKPVKIYRNLTNIKSLTIAVPTYNGALTIFRTLDSVIENLKEIPAFIKKELIICTDHCTDNTFLLVKNFIDEKKDEKINIALVNNDNIRGKANALNKIFCSSSGELFGVVDDDVILENNCLLNLIKALVNDNNLRCVFSARVRLPLKSHNPWRLFWYWILGIKFDVNPYDKPSGIVRGQSIMLRRENFVHFPAVLNEDQFLHYIYWPKTKEIGNSIIYFNYVSSVYDYYRRAIRLKLGSKQMSKHFTKERLHEYSHAVIRKINYQKILQLPWKLKIPFMFYKFVTFIITLCVKTKLRFIKNYEWYRFKQY
jgi:glycosyltransferase involved in cell wall biosynthesis